MEIVLPSSSRTLQLMAPFPFLSLLLLVVLLTSIPLPSTFSQSILVFPYCDKDDNFTANSTYQSNLQLLLPSLASSAIPSGFNTSSIGSQPDRVHALALCRGDLPTETCKTCLNAAASDAEQNCPYAKSARIFYDYCHVRYSKLSFIKTIDTDTRCLWGNNLSSSDNARFNASMRAMLGVLRSYAVHNATSPPLFAAGEIEFGGTYDKINGMVQCTRDISADQCDQCLDKIIKDLSWCYGQRSGARALTGTCSWRYETYEFFNLTQRLRIPALTEVSPGNFQLQPPSSPPTALPPAATDGAAAGDGDVGHQNSGDNNTRTTILAIAIPFGVAALLLNLIGCICLYRKKGVPPPSISNNEGTMQETSTNDSLLFGLDSIKRATNNFSPSNKLGEGGFGPVYKGRLSDGRDIAVKMLSPNSSQGIEELKNEMLLQTRLLHRNLARILGACVEGGEKMLIYELAENESLDAYLSNHIKKLSLNWEVRCKIIEGIARGLLYLHEESQLKIIHRDIKASNVLLDGDMNPKISDFGTARLFDENQTRACTKKIVGTFGYMPPEYVMEGQYSIKSDIYSFGVLILEVITGRRNCEQLADDPEELFDLLSYVWEHWSRESPTTVVDPSMEGNYPRSEAVRFIQIGLLCVQHNPMNRPTMEEVHIMLSSESISIHSPLQVSGTFTIERPQVYSPNDVTISEFEPR